MSLAIVGWTVVHSLWQWTIVAGVAALILGLLRGGRPQTRYLVGWSAVAMMMLSSVATFWTAAATFDQSWRHRALYAFDGLLMIPPLVPYGATILRVTAILWLLWMVARVIGLIADWYRLRQLDHFCASPVDATCARLAEEVQRRMNVRRSVALHCSTQVVVPMVLGWRRPRILLPTRTSRLLTSDETRAVLAHELAHVARGDLAANLAQAIADLVLFHHPGARWMSRRIRIEREYLLRRSRARRDRGCRDLRPRACDARRCALRYPARRRRSLGHVARSGAAHPQPAAADADAGAWRSGLCRSAAVGGKHPRCGDQRAAAVGTRRSANAPPDARGGERHSARSATTALTRVAR